MTVSYRIKKLPEGTPVDSTWKATGPGRRKRTRTYPNGLVTEEQECVCPDCGKPWPDQFIVHNYLWKEFGVGYGVLCFQCFEKRMGRKLTVFDLKACSINGLAFRMAGFPIPGDQLFPTKAPQKDSPSDESSIFGHGNENDGYPGPTCIGLAPKKDTRLEDTLKAIDLEMEKVKL